MSKPPFTLAVAAAVLALEGLTILGLGGYVAVQTVIGDPLDVSMSIAMAAIGVVVGAAVVWVAYGALAAQRWSRSPGVLAQIFAVPVAVTLIQSGRQVAGAALLVVAAAGLVTLLSPPSTRVLYDGAFPDGTREEPAEKSGEEPAERRPAEDPTAKPIVEPERPVADPAEKPAGRSGGRPRGKRPGSGPGRRPR